METPTWLDRSLYPFRHHTFTTEAGNLHYLDEGTGEPIVFVHGTPTWSFVWRQQIQDLRRTHRCIAPDHLGFGLSDKPDAFAYTPEAHALNLEKLLEHLQLKNITLVVHDFGGPIGLYYALQHPEKVKKIVILNSWMWSLQEEQPGIIKISKFMSSGLGKFLYLRIGFSPRVLLPQGFYNRSYLSKQLHRQYLKPLSSPTARKGTWHLAAALHASSAYFAKLWEQRESIRAIPKLVVWGKKDKLLPLALLHKWETSFPEEKVIRVDAGHFLQEEAAQAVTEHISRFVSQQVYT